MPMKQDALGYGAGYGTEYAYDLANRMTSILNPVGKSRSLPFDVKHTYDALGRKIKETNANGVETDYTYSDKGNLLSKHIDGTVVQTNTYDLFSNQLTSADGNGNTTGFTYNALNLIRQKTLPEDTSINA